ncbi:ATP-binding protein [Hyphomicrobium sp. MC1]|uniref:ATP-binding protein n=1 Tax=Hyphomicrobium sp. (strain MC1) TaxID=717785 RepID=UPI000213EFE5|nr:ATP-binding protein [Hyphomicrobium sp. MC1]CCB66690.1 putative anti-sigma regulatory factor, serine/threonine protein kinase [Hyphomicrobium sp. MC1]
MSGELSLRLHLEEGTPKQMPEIIAEFLSVHDLPEGLLQPFAVVFDEILSNIAAYGYPEVSEKVVDVRLSIKDGEIRAEVEDGGIAFDPLQIPDPDTTLDVTERPIGGLGILLVRKLMDRVTYERRDGRNVLRFAKATLTS